MTVQLCLFFGFLVIVAVIFSPIESKSIQPNSVIGGYYFHYMLFFKHSGTCMLLKMTLRSWSQMFGILRVGGRLERAIVPRDQTDVIIWRELSSETALRDRCSHYTLIDSKPTPCSPYKQTTHYLLVYHIIHSD